jgi:F0F1-type ATP synthase assembly protein I
MVRDATPEPVRRRAADPSAVLAYLSAGVGFWGGVGWLVDRWLGTSFVVGIGLLLGAAAGIYLVYLRFGRG